MGCGICGVGTAVVEVLFLLASQLVLLCGWLIVNIIDFALDKILNFTKVYKK